MDPKQMLALLCPPRIQPRVRDDVAAKLSTVLCKHYGGKWPFWLSLCQVIVLPIHADWNDYCQAVHDRLHDEGFYTDVDLSKNTFKKKVANAQDAQYNFILVCGEAEVKNNTVNMRTRENKVEGEFSVDDMVNMFKRLSDEYK